MIFKKILLPVNICLAILVLAIPLTISHIWKHKGHEKTRLEGQALKSKSSNVQSFTKPRKEKDYEIIILRDVFKTKKASQKAGIDLEKPIKITELNLKLMGTVVGKDTDCFAIIMDGSTQKPGLYRLNDFIQDTRIVRILSDRVILNLDGKEEQLVFTDEPIPSVRKERPKRRLPAPTRRKIRRPVT